LALRNQERAAEYCETILEKMEKIWQSHNATMTSTHATSMEYNRINAKVSFTELTNIEKTALNKLASNTCRPNTRTYNAVINAWAKAETLSSGEKAEKVLLTFRENYLSTHDIIIQPSDKSYNKVINAWAKCRLRDAASQAERILKFMDDDFQSGRNTNAKPNAVSYNTVLMANTYLNGEEAASNAYRILQKIEQIYKDGDENMKPDSITYYMVIKTFSRVQDSKSLQMAEKILQGMKITLPNEYIYLTIIDGWAKSDEPDADVRAESILNHLIESYKTGNVKLRPTYRGFESTLKAINKVNKSDAPERSESLLEQLIGFYNDGDQSCKPNVNIFFTVIDTWDKSKQSEKADKTVVVLRKMQDIGIRPITSIYDAILRTCANTSGDEEVRRNAMNTAETILKEIELSNLCRASTYTIFLEACNNLLKDLDQDKCDVLAESVFEKSKLNGQVHLETLTWLEKVASPALYTSMLGEYISSDGKEIDVDNLPKEWSCNL